MQLPNHISITRDVGIANVCTFILCVALLAVAIRIILSFFKAWAIVQGEADEVSEVTKKVEFFGERNLLVAWWKSILSCGKHRNVDDHFLPLAVGIIELLIHPVLIVAGRWDVIGAWIGVKTATHLTSWKRSRTPYNRFLLGILLGLLAAYFLAWLFVRRS